jgi:prepilin-type N-terminal cleavage/methylation domain-containing protein/prepilin-type processing-associated H-X9-DG protein
MRHPTTRAFTLIELLMVIAIIGILASLLAGGIAQAKGRAHSITCMNNQRQLLVVWQKYAGDSDDRLVVNSNPVSSMTPLTTNFPWASSGTHQFYPSVTNEAFLTDPNYSAFAYAKLNPRLYRCAGIKHNIQGVPIIRTYSMNPYMGGRSSTWSAPTGFETYQRMNDITQPAERLVFSEMNPFIICTSAIRINSLQAETDTNSPALGTIISADFATLPMFGHGRIGQISYADGHVEPQKQQTEEFTRTWPVDWLAFHSGLHSATNADALWYANRLTRAR